MAEINYNVNPDELENSFNVVPAGEYVAIIEDSDYVPNNQGTGMILKLTYQIIDGPGDCKGRKLFNNLNLQNKSQQAVEIAKRTLNSICVATGHTGSVADSSMLHNKAMLINVTVKDDPSYGKQNKISKHSPVPVQSVAGSQPQSGFQQQTQPESQGRPPWQK